MFFIFKAILVFFSRLHLKSQNRSRRKTLYRIEYANVKKCEYINDANNCIKIKYICQF